MDSLPPGTVNSLTGERLVLKQRARSLEDLVGLHLVRTDCPGLESKIVFLAKIFALEIEKGHGGRTLRWVVRSSLSG